MLEKDPGDPKIHRLRVIHIYEDDYNLFLSIQWLTLMHSAEDQHLLNEGQYGYWPHRNAHDPVFLEEMQFERDMPSKQETLGYKFDNDATSCYDRILPNMASIACRKFGLHREVWRSFRRRH